MAFGQSAGPAATGRQVKELLELLGNLGHADFRDARGPMGFNQRQAGGRFTADEAAELIDQLQAAEHAAAQGEPVAPAEEEPDPEPQKPVSELTDHEKAIRTAPTKWLVLEVRRRGWTVTKPK
ncbi:MAG: hypothetical protein P8P85_11970 [Acidimicrobiales bacterium]|nr:hypothetical protein [Acidimicrobiales bacterium]